MLFFRRYLGFVITFLFLFTIGFSYTAWLKSRTVKAAAAMNKPSAANFLVLPLRFEQAQQPGEYLARGKGYALRLSADGARIGLPTDSTEHAALKLKLRGARAGVNVRAENELPGKSHYFLGNDRRRWRMNVPSYERVVYEGVYPGIDLVWHGAQQQLEYDFVVAPGAAPQHIQMQFDGAQDLRVTPDGKLRVSVGGRSVELLKPVAWQDIAGERKPIDCAYRLDAQRRVAFTVGEYDRRQRLVIDPILLYSTFLGGSSSETGAAIALDKNRNIYVTGQTASADFPEANPLNPLPSQSSDVFVTKLNAAGTTLLYSVVFGGAGFDESRSLAVDNDGNAYVTGITTSANFPVTAGALQSSTKGFSDGFVIKLNSNGSALSYATYLGGDSTDSSEGIAVDAGGNAYVAGTTNSFDLLTGKVNSALQLSRAGTLAFRSANQGANWNSVSNGLRTSQVYSFAFDPKTAGAVYAVTQSGIFKTTNDGGSWAALPGTNTFALSQNNSTMVIDSVTPSNLYVGTTRGIRKSTDGGQTWQEKNNGINTSGTPAINTLVIDLVAPEILYIGTSAGVFRTANGGEAWLPANNGLSQFGQRAPQVQSLALDPVNRQTVYAATGNGIYKTTDAGLNWTAAGNGLTAQVRWLVIDPTAPQTLYAGLYFGGVFKSTDGGANWSVRNTGLGLNNQPGSILSLAHDGKTSGVLYVLSSVGFFKTTNGGSNWSSINNSDLTQFNYLTIAVNPATASAGQLYVGAYIGSDGFAAKLAPDGKTAAWMTYLGGVEDDQLNGLALDKDGGLVVAGYTYSPNYASLNNQAIASALSDVLFARINPAGTALSYSGRFGGSGYDVANSVALTASGKLVLAGVTTTTGAPFGRGFQTSIGSAYDAFVAGLNANANGLDFATWLGGSADDFAYGVAVDAAGNIFVTGSTTSPNFPLRDELQSQLNPPNGGAFIEDAFVTKLNADASALIFSTILGGREYDFASGLALDSFGQVYVVGTTGSANFPTAQPWQSGLREQDAFITKIGVEADLVLAVSQQRNPVQLNSEYSYMLTVTNNGLSPASNVVVTDTLPAAANFISANSCTHNAGTVTCNLGALAYRATKTIVITVKPTLTGTALNAARVTAAEPDPIATNNVVNTSTAIGAQSSLHGRVTLPAPTASGQLVPLAGVTLQISGTQAASRATNDDGYYQFTTANGGTFTITPSRVGYSFEPAARNLTNVTTDQQTDFSALPCSYSLTATSQSFGASGGNGMVSVQATPRCPWTATSNANWITITGGAAGSGNGMVSFSVATTITPRVGRITVAGQAFTVWQGVNECSTARFGTAIYPAFGTIPTFAAQRLSVDFNGDGRTDWVTLNSGTLAVMIANGNGTLGAPSIIGNAGFGSALMAAEFNGDNRPDLVITRFSTNSVTVLLSRNDGTFQTGTDYQVSMAGVGVSTATSIATDLNRDGKLDLLFVEQPRQFGEPSLVYVLLNQGNGGFGASLTLIIGGFVIGKGDFTSDGIIDLLAWQRVGEEIVFRVYPGDGLGSFIAPVTTAKGASLTDATVVADFNGDGFNDFANLSNLNNAPELSFYVALGDGKGAFRAPLIQTLPANLRVSGRLVTADFNHDAKPDLSFISSNRLVMVLGDGSGRFSFPLFSNLYDETHYSGDLQLGDFNGDGRVDVSTSYDDTSSFGLHLNRCAAANGGTIAGRIRSNDFFQTMADVPVKLTGARTAETRTDAGGNFEFSGLTAGGTYVVTPDRPGIGFTPANRRVENLAADQYLEFIGQRQVVVASAANYRTDSIAPGSIVSVFGTELSNTTEAARTVPLPFTLGGTQVKVFSGSGAYSKDARLFYAAPQQLNVLLPDDVPLGAMNLSVTVTPPNGAAQTARSVFNVESIAPGLFTVDSTGLGYASALALRIKADGSLVYEPITRFDFFPPRPFPIPLDLSNPAEQVFLVLFGTGFSRNNSLANVSAQIGGATAEVLYAGPQGGFAGLDQVNLRVPRSLAGRGDVNIQLTIAGRTANVVRVNIK